MNIDTYLERIGLSGPLEPTLQSLRTIHVAHLATFPFHNLEIQRGGAIKVDVDSIEKKFLGRDGGGYCFEQNTLLAEVLRALGFAVTPMLARVGSPERAALNHLVLRVEADGRPWLADVGFGGEGILEPIPLEDGARAEQSGIVFLLTGDESRRQLCMEVEGERENLYSFAELPCTSGDVQMANHYTSTFPTSMFRSTLTIQQITPEERIILRPALVRRYRDGKRHDTPHEPGAVRELARSLFGVELGEELLLFEKLQAGAER